MPPIINGLIFGLIFIFALGPAFFALIQTSIQQGFKKAILLAVGISISDTFYVLIVLLGMTKMLQTNDFKFWMAVFGSIMLVSYATYSWLKEPKIMSEKAIAKDSKLYQAPGKRSVFERIESIYYRFMGHLGECHSDQF